MKTLIIFSYCVTMGVFLTLMFMAYLGTKKIDQMDDQEKDFL